LKILYSWEWGAGAGHLRRFVPLASRLREAGHEVTIVAKELYKLPSLFPFNQYRWIQTPESGRANAFISAPCSFAEVAFNLGFDTQDRVTSICGAWFEILRQQRPDLVICDFGVACSWVAAALSIPTLRIGTGYSCPPTGSEARPFIAGENKASETAEMVVDLATAAIQDLGLGYKPCWNDVLLSSDRTLLDSLPPLDPYREFRSIMEYSGTWDHDGQVQPRWEGRGKYKAVAYLKPFPHLPQLLASLHSLQIETILFGDGIPYQLIHPIRNPLLVLSEAPLRFSGLVPHCDFVICNANHGTVAKALGQGIPVYSIPLYLEHRVTAALIEDELWGVSGDPRIPSQYLSKTSEITSSAIRESASRYPGLVTQYTDRGLEHAWSKLQAFLA
jgi:hypothetical protein